ncbi:MAG: urea transport system permease protein [Gammaproteobacteria bacterium]|jgi:urea transport system permease protein
MSSQSSPTAGPLMRLFTSDRGGSILLGTLIVIGVAVPLLHLLTPPESAIHVSTYAVTLLGKYLCFALLALALDLVWGYLGILSLGHGAFFALGGYAMGMYLMRQIGSRGVYGNPELPDFMVFLNWQELPWYWYGFDSFPFAMSMVILMPGVLALVFGWLAFRSRVTGVYLSIMTQALTYALMLAFFRNNMGFGGNNGLTDFKDILGFDLQASSTRIVLFMLSALMLGLGYVLCKKLTRSRLGRVAMAVRDAEGRVRSLGYRDEHVKLFIFVVSAVMAGIAGALYVPQVGIINPGEFAPLNSIEMVIWVAIGGRGTLFGAAFGAVLVNFAKSYLTVAYPEIWLFFLGALFVLVTVFLPRGIVGLLNSIRTRASQEKPASTTGSADAIEHTESKNGEAPLLPASEPQPPQSERTPVP